MRGQEPISTGAAIAGIAWVLSFLVDFLTNAVGFVTANALGILIVLVAITSVKDVVFTGENLIFSVLANTYYILIGLLNPITRNEVNLIPILNWFVDNPVTLLFLTAINAFKLFLFFDIVFFKFGSLVIQWYSFCWGFIEPFVIPQGISERIRQVRSVGTLKTTSGVINRVRDYPNR